MPARGMRHGKTAGDELAAVHVQDAAAAGFVDAPAARSISRAQSGDIARDGLSLFVKSHRQAVEVTTIVRGERGDKGGPPTGDKTVVGVERAETRETGAHHP